MYEVYGVIGRIKSLGGVIATTLKFRVRQGIFPIYVCTSMVFGVLNANKNLAFSTSTSSALMPNLFGI